MTKAIVVLLIVISIVSLCQESTKEELKERFTWDKTVPVGDNLLHIGVSIIMFGFIAYGILKCLTFIFTTR